MHLRPPADASAFASLHHLFAYGSLVDPRCLDDVLGHRHPGERLRARLHGYERLTSPSFPFPFIVKADGQAVDGVLIMELNPYDIDTLDRYEEVETGAYRREIVEVETWGCGPRTVRLDAYTYVAGQGLDAATAT